jgi:hypothetical protein
MLKRLTPELEQRIHRCLREFPELAGKAVTVGLTRAADGTAEIEQLVVRLNVRRRKPVSCFTIGHELTHLLQGRGIRTVPHGEVQCDVWTLSRSELFLDDRPSYLCPHLWTQAGWEQHAASVRQLCIQAIAQRTRNRRYLVWLTAQLEKHVQACVEADRILDS